MKRVAKDRFFLCFIVLALLAAGLFLPSFTPFQRNVARGIRSGPTLLVAAEAAEEDGEASFHGDVVTAGGIGKISSKSAVSRELARRAALLDARRNLLIEARRIREGVTGRKSVSGHVGYHWMVSERRDGYLYKVTLAARLADIRVD